MFKRKPDLDPEPEKFNKHGPDFSIINSKHFTKTSIQPLFTLQISNIPVRNKNSLLKVSIYNDNESIWKHP